MGFVAFFSLNKSATNDTRAMSKGISTLVDKSELRFVTSILFTPKVNAASPAPSKIIPLQSILETTLVVFAGKILKL
ncbi:hypothetical protein SDC9_208749 [bioreactor metagenome]|uniref:Uncharacterized protein n=1 Tax=bioreactor metagenome TaxID=1076179 RepID=A0A645JBC6_9ZZZZ